MITLTRKAYYKKVMLKSELSDLIKEVQAIQDIKKKMPVYRLIGLKEIEIRKHESLYEGVI